MGYTIRRAFGHAAWFAIMLGAPIAASAQALNSAAVGPANPGRVEEQVRAPQSSNKETPQIQVEGQKREVAPAGSEKITFILKDIKTEGVTVYTQTQIHALYADRLGQKISLADLYDIASAMTSQYRNDGYILTRVIVPPQTIDDGIARLRVVEGYVDKISVSGGQDSARPLIESYASRIRQDGPANIRDIERSLLLINDLPGIKARSILSPSKTNTGASDLQILVTRKPFDAQLDANNYGTKYLGPYQLGAAGSLNSALGMNERITAQTVYAPGARLEPELMYYALGYMQPVGMLGTKIRLDASYTDTDPGFTLKQFDVEGKSEFLAATVEHPFIRSRRINLNGHLTLDARDVKTEDNIQPDRKDRIRAVRSGARLEYLSTALGVAYNMAEFEVSQGLSILGSTDNKGSNVSRPGADQTFTKIEAELQRLQRVAESINVLAAVHGQKASNPLLTSEQFGVGGMNYGRGYDPSEIIGDDGVAGKLEVQWQKPVNLPFIDEWQAFGFYDIGRVWQQEASSSVLKTNSLASTGFGMRGTFESGTSMDALVAFPLTRDVQTQGDKDARFLVGISQKF